VAGTIYCDDHAEAPAVLLITNLESGEVASICGPCVGPWALSMAVALGMIPDPDAAGAAESNGETPGEGAAAPDPPRRKRSRQGDQETPRELQAAASPFPDVAPDDS